MENFKNCYIAAKQAGDIYVFVIESVKEECSHHSVVVMQVHQKVPSLYPVLTATYGVNSECYC